MMGIVEGCDTKKNKLESLLVWETNIYLSIYLSSGS